MYLIYILRFLVFSFFINVNYIKTILKIEVFIYIMDVSISSCCITVISSRTLPLGLRRAVLTFYSTGKEEMYEKN